MNERMICHAIIGKNPLKERIMTVDVTAEFIAPLLEFSSKKLLFSLRQVRSIWARSIGNMVIHVALMMSGIAKVYSHSSVWRIR